MRTHPIPPHISSANAANSFNNGPALKAASASSASALYLPRTAFRVSTSVTLTKPLVVACGASLSVDAGVTLTITAQPRLACPSRSPVGHCAVQTSTDWYRLVQTGTDWHRLASQ